MGQLNLLLEGLDESAEFLVERRSSDVIVLHDSVFDRHTGERDTMCLMFDIAEYERGLRGLRDKGVAEVSGENGYLRLMRNPNGTLTIIMSAARIGRSIVLPMVTYRLEDVEA